MVAVMSTMLSYVLVLMFVIPLSTGSWLPTRTLGWSNGPPPRSVPLSGEADVAARSLPESQGRDDFFALARERLALMEHSSTCKRSATMKLFVTCESLEVSPDLDINLETVQNFYSAHLAMCELDGAHANLPSHCRLGLPSDASELASFLRDNGAQQLKRCLTSLQSRSQWWTSYSNNRRDAYILCKAMRPFDQDDFVRSLKDVLSTSEAVAQALDSFIKDTDSKTRDQREFAANVDVFRQQLILDLEKSSAEVSNRLTSLVAQADSAVKAILMRLTNSVRDATTEADGLAQVIHSGNNDAQHLNELVLNSQKVVVNGISAISLAQKQQLHETNDLAIKLQTHLEWMVDTRIYEVVGNASDRLQFMMEQMDGLQKDVQSTSEHFHILDVKIAALMTILPSIANMATRFWKWSFVLLAFVTMGWKSGLSMMAILATWEATSNLTDLSSDLDRTNPEILLTTLLPWILRVLALSLVAALVIYKPSSLGPLKGPKWPDFLDSLSTRMFWYKRNNNSNHHHLPYQASAIAEPRIKTERHGPLFRVGDPIRFSRAASEPPT